MAVLLITVTASAADVPAQPVAKKGALIFSDDFSAPEVGKAWRAQWPGLAIADGALNISQIKPEHSAVGLVAVGKKDLMIEFKFKLGGATSINAVCNDRDFNEGHRGHICPVSLSPQLSSFTAPRWTWTRLPQSSLESCARMQSRSHEPLSEIGRHLPWTES